MNMLKKGCDSCRFRKEIKVEELKTKYLFRCAAQSKYMKEEDLKLRCNLYEGNIKITQQTIFDFLDS